MATAALHLTSRDMTALGELGEVGMMDTLTIHDRHFPKDLSLRSCRRRLRLYEHHGLARTLAARIVSPNHAEKNLSSIHCLTERGAEVLKELTGVEHLRVPRSDPRPEMLHHRLGVARVQLIVNDACRGQAIPRPAWILEQDSRPGVPKDAPLTDRFTLFESFSAADGARITCRPDASCWLQIPASPPSEPQRMYSILVYWEFDRSTEMLSQFARKLPGYHALLSTQTFRKHWPHVSQPTVCVFVVTPSQERLENIAEAICELPGGDAFRLTTIKDLTPERFLTAPIWRTVNGECRAIRKVDPIAS